jgi:FMN phosphatase YigB (HAD superfamily)
MLKVVLFDGDKVIYYKEKNYDKEFFERLEAKSGFKNIRSVFQLLRQDCKKRVYNRIELFKRLLNIIGLDEDPAEIEKEYSKIKADKIFLFKRIVTALKSLKNNNVKIGLMSDSIFTSEEKRKWFKRLSIEEYFDYYFTSYSLNASKVNIESFKKVLNTVKCEPEEVLMVGHEYSDFLGAMQLGIPTLSVGDGLSTTYNVKNYEEIPKFLEEKGLIK